MIKKSTVKEIFWISLLLGTSLFSGAGVLAFYALSILYIVFNKDVGATKVLLLLAYRSIVNDKLFYAISGMQSIKWVVMFGVSAYILFCFQVVGVERKKLYQSYMGLIGFSLYIVATSFIISSLPMISIFKLFSYAFVFAAIMKGISLTYKEIDWILWLEKLLGSIVCLSCFMYNLSAGWHKQLFQGFTNQPNMLGIILVLFLALLLVNFTQIHKNRGIRFLFVGITFFLIFESGARTAFISALVITIYSICLSDIRFAYKAIIIATLVTIAYLVISSNGSISMYLDEFIYKYEGSEDNIFYSRESQIEEMMDNIAASPILGNGFGVPRLKFVSYSLSYTFFLEPGNLVLAILSYSGIIGTILFVAMLGNILLANAKRNNVVLILPIATILTSMGEMVFFSSNSMAIWLYAFWGIYLFNRTDRKAIKMDRERGCKI